MIIINESVVNPLYTRVTISRAFIQAEIAIHSKILKNSIQPSTPIHVSKYGIMYIDSVVQQGENIILRAYDPLAYYCKYRLTKVFNTADGTWRSPEGSKALYAMYDFLYAQTEATDLDDLHITLNQPEDLGKETTIEARYDNVFDVYTKIPESYEPACRMNITPVSSNEGYTVYLPEMGKSAPKRLEAPYTVDYAQHASIPQSALVHGKQRNVFTVVGDGRRQIYVNAPMTPNYQYFLVNIGQDALQSAKSENTSITVRMLEKYLPDIKPADSILLNDDTTYTVYSIEHSTSPQGELVYLACGGHVMTVSDRLNALVAADYASRI